jgi:hypothetical protein
MAMPSELLLAAANRDGDIRAVTEKVELAPFLDGRLLPMASARVPAPVSTVSRPESCRGRIRFEGVGGRNSLSDRIGMARPSMGA